VRRTPALALATVAALAAPVPTVGDDALSLRADAQETGWIRLHLHAEPGVEVVVQEQGEAERRIVPAATDTTLRRFASWRCDRRERTFVARQIGSDGVQREDPAVVQTASCGHRLALSAPRRVRAGRPLLVRIRDRWRLGDLAASVCTRAPGEQSRCRTRRPRAFRYRALRAGRHRISLRTPWQRARRTVHAAGPGGRLTVLATGDSMIQIIDSYLKQRIGSSRTRVRSDAHIATGLSKPSLLDWQAYARHQARAARPDVTVMFIGANDGFPMGDADCCGQAWVAEYGRRARRMMRSYARGGRGRVYWLLLPAPRGGFFREVFPAVNAGLRRAAHGLEDDVELIDLPRVFTPGGRYRDAMKLGGKLVRVRQSDGIHLNTAGASLAASIVIRALRRDRMLD
jgi:lysophospholipase L1-like esterase